MPDTSAFGTRIELGDAADPENFTEIARVRDISGPGITQSFAEVTAHDSPGRYKEWIATLLELGQITFDIVWDPNNATHDNTSGILAELTGGSKNNYQVVFPTNPAITWTIPAFVESLSPAEPVDGALMASVTLKPSGQPTLA